MSTSSPNSERVSLSEVDSRDTNLLNELLRAELCAWESYTRCLVSLDNVSQTEVLTNIRTSHFKRIGLLHQRIERLGASPLRVAEPWRRVESVLDSPAALTGESALLSALCEEEGRSLEMYQECLNELSPIQCHFVQVELLPEQAFTCSTMKNIGTH